MKRINDNSENEDLVDTSRYIPKVEQTIKTRSYDLISTIKIADEDYEIPIRIKIISVLRDQYYQGKIWTLAPYEHLPEIVKRAALLIFYDDDAAPAEQLFMNYFIEDEFRITDNSRQLLKDINWALLNRIRKILI